ncbi:hypothetical protein SAMN02745127_02978 [Oceanospirillum multiglobuliferum]|uniref:Uncharacterized protein n=1 Tax=Oceanospirillum multiglobuliferum TaxID=64969 RepID=A0A1T4SDS5_9GAMM|nr:hypothetical protein [Oceanospirillum multiglobuliferum]OPX54319.1 hypothetical protein BTE48_14745 [Oceanospirillum multiglobuliferum]SKA26369.1 hypothetical protein SAMN02745127_02978 [Oceanospirillum multiglobuliferum]
MPRNYVNQSKIDHDFGWLNDQATNAESYADFTSRASLENVARAAKMSLVPGYRLIRVVDDADHFSIVLLCDTTKEIVYFVKCHIWEDVVLNNKPLTQVMLWRTAVIKHRRVTSGFAEDLFRLYLLERYSIIASDSCQTREGRDFWVRQLGYALEFGEYIYRYDRIAGQLQAITDHAMVINNACDLWGDDARYENILAIISKDPLN